MIIFRLIYRCFITIIYNGNCSPFIAPVDVQLAALEEGNLEKLVAHMGNVLERVTVPEYPVINEIKQKMMDHGALGAMMSGSGPTVFGIFTSYAKAKEAYQAIERSGLSKQIYLTTPYNRKEEQS